MSSITNPHTHTSLTRTIPSHILVSQPANPTHTLNPSAYSLTSPPPPPLSLCIAFILHFYPPPHPRCLPYTLSVMITFHPFPQHHFLPTYHFTPSPHTLNPSAIVLLLHPFLSPCSSFIPCFTLLHTIGAYLTPSPSPSHFIPLHIPSPFTPSLPSPLPLFTS